MQLGTEGQKRKCIVFVKQLNKLPRPGFGILHLALISHATGRIQHQCDVRVLLLAMPELKHTIDHVDWRNLESSFGFLGVNSVCGIKWSSERHINGCRA